MQPPHDELDSADDTPSTGRLVDGLRDPQLRRRAAIVILLLVATVQLVRIGAADFRDGPIVGDQAAHLLQAMSIAEEANLSFAASDIENWQEVGWGPAPRGVFYQEYEHGYAFAKPYGAPRSPTRCSCSPCSSASPRSSASASMS